MSSFLLLTDEGNYDYMLAMSKRNEFAHHCKGFYDFCKITFLYNVINCYLKKDCTFTRQTKVHTKVHTKVKVMAFEETWVGLIHQ